MQTFQKNSLILTRRQGSDGPRYCGVNVQNVCKNAFNGDCCFVYNLLAAFTVPYFEVKKTKAAQM